jgi:hypothetical protein
MTLPTREPGGLLTLQLGWVAMTDFLIVARWLLARRAALNRFPEPRRLIMPACPAGCQPGYIRRKPFTGAFTLP